MNDKYEATLVEAWSNMTSLSDGDTKVQPWMDITLEICHLRGNILRPAPNEIRESRKQLEKPVYPFYVWNYVRDEAFAVLEENSLLVGLGAVVSVRVRCLTNDVDIYVDWRRGMDPDVVHVTTVSEPTKEKNNERYDHT